MSVTRGTGVHLVASWLSTEKVWPSAPTDGWLLPVNLLGWQHAVAERILYTVHKSTKSLAMPPHHHKEGPPACANSF